MGEQTDIKRQLRYKDSIYDVLKDIKLGNYNYLIIGKELNNKFIDIDFVEQRFEEGKIRYISANSNVIFNKETTNFKRIQGQSLMNYIINEIKDNINSGTLVDVNATIDYIERIYNTIISSNDINTFFMNENNYDTELQLEESIKTLIGYYVNEIKNYGDVNKLPTGEVLVSEEEIKDIYDKLEDTQNFGVSLIHDAITNEKNPDDYIVDPTNSTFENSSNTSGISNYEEEKEKRNNIFVDMPADNVVSNNDLALDNHNLTFQERLYLENEERINNRNQSQDLQDNLEVKTKTLTLHNSYGRQNSAAYITISWLLYIIGSFELFIAIVLMAKFF